MINIESILNGEVFCDKKMSNALQLALDFAGPKGYVVTMPELIATKAKTGKINNSFKEIFYNAHTEENIGVDKQGRFYAVNKPVLVLVNGGGILNPKRIKKACDKTFFNECSKYADDEFNDLLDGRLPDGTSIKLYHFNDEIMNNISDLPHQFGIVMPYSVAQNTKSSFFQKKEFMENPLAIARAGGIENLESYYEHAKAVNNYLGCFHPFGGCDASVPRGCTSFFYDHSAGSLSQIGFQYNICRFIGVSARPQDMQK